MADYNGKSREGKGIHVGDDYDERELPPVGPLAYRVSLAHQLALEKEAQAQPLPGWPRRHKKQGRAGASLREEEKVGQCRQTRRHYCSRRNERAVTHRRSAAQGKCL